MIPQAFTIKLKAVVPQHPRIRTFPDPGLTSKCSSNGPKNQMQVVYLAYYAVQPYQRFHPTKGSPESDYVTANPPAGPTKYGEEVLSRR